MGDPIVIKGRLTGPRQVELDEPVAHVTPEVEVILRPLSPPAPTRALVDFLRALPAGQRTRAEIDRQLSEQRDDWENRA